MKTTLIYILLLAIILLLVFSQISIHRNVSRLEQNQSSLFQNGTKELYLTRQEFMDYSQKQNDSLISYIKDSLKLKFKHITSTIEHKYYYSYDSTFTQLTPALNGNHFDFEKEFDNCLKIAGRVKDSTIYWDKVEIDYQAQTIYYWQRKHKILGIHFGKKEFYGITKNNCTGSSEVLKIEIEKR
jgi:hypothetical protein